MPRLGQNRLRRLAACACGDAESGNFGYKRHVDLDVFFEAVEGAPDWEDPEASRMERAFQFVSACNRTSLGTSTLPEGVEALIRYILNLGEFDDEEQRDGALVDIRKVLDGYPVDVEIGGEGDVELRSTRTDRRQRLIDEELHTAFGEVLHESDLRVARFHYSKARHLLATDDYPNSAKEAVCAVEACLSTLTGERDVRRALRKATDAGLPKPLDGVIEKLYAWRGNEPGVAHGGDAAPAVTKADAQFALNLSAAINLYLRQRLIEGAPAPDDDPAPPSR